jgi:hypothetical protein
LATVCLLIVAAANAQFNIDLDAGSPPEGGGGVPNFQFAGAGSQPGFWNSLPATGHGPLPLFDPSGNPTNVLVTGPAGGGGGGWTNALNTGGYRALLNDGHQVSGLHSWSFTGITNGLYRIIVYAVWPNDLTTATFISVSGSITPNRQVVTGPMPGNQFIVGITHSVHDIEVTSNSFTIQADRSANLPGFVNGMQIVPVPEANLVLGLSVGLLAFAMRRRTQVTR